jgi:hypothetical protein
MGQIIGTGTVADDNLDHALLWTAPTAALGDITHDGVVDVDDLLAVINAWGACDEPCPADIAPETNGDGIVNVDDLLMVINNWG